MVENPCAEQIPTPATAPAQSDYTEEKSGNTLEKHRISFTEEISTHGGNFSIRYSRPKRKGFYDLSYHESFHAKPQIPNDRLQENLGLSYDPETLNNITNPIDLMTYFTDKLDSSHIRLRLGRSPVPSRHRLAIGSELTYEPVKIIEGFVRGYKIATILDDYLHDDIETTRDVPVELALPGNVSSRWIVPPLAAFLGGLAFTEAKLTVKWNPRKVPCTTIGVGVGTSGHSIFHAIKNNYEYPSSNVKIIFDTAELQAEVGVSF